MTETLLHTDGDAAFNEDDSLGRIAIVGMSGRFPGARTIAQFWNNIRQGKDSFVTFTPDEIEDAFSDETRAAPDYVASRPFLEDVDKFDAEFFGMYPREAALTDPQFRVFLEICWEALEDAGYDPQKVSGPISVFAGSAMATYLINNVLSDRERVEEFTSNYQIGCFSELVGAINDTLATRVAYKLNLRGPAVTVQCACSTSLVAVTQACQSLLTYQSDMALAGGVSITFPQKRGYIYQEGGMASPDGRCLPFDEQAAGTVFGSGAGVVLLKRLEDALAEGDHIYAVIRGYGLNNDGSQKAGYTAPSVDGQADAIRTAYANAGIDARTIGYIECHGTATPLGDPIEFSGLLSAFGNQDRKSRCALGSVKGNVGHLDAAAGVAGLIKAALVLHHGEIPALPNFRTPNPRIDLANSPFFIPTDLIEWPRSVEPRRVGVSSFGVGGTNAHVVMEEAPSVPAVSDREEQEEIHILPLSARSEAALTTMRFNLAAWLKEQPGISLSRMAHTLQVGRRDFPHRTTIACRNVNEAIARLQQDRLVSGNADSQPPSVIFMFPGQGAQYVGMAGDLYAGEPEFSRWIDRGADFLQPLIDADIRDFICCDRTTTDEEKARMLRDTKLAQPALYLIEYALARFWMSRGLMPDAMIGHSVGEFVAATLANTMSFDDGLRLVAARGKLMQLQPAGAMISVRAPLETAMKFTGDGVDLAAVNAPKLCVLAGPFEAIEAVSARLTQEEIAFSRLHTSHAFHSAMMDNAVVALRRETEMVAFGKATIPYVSCVTGDWQDTESGASPEYWAQHCRAAVRFADGIARICEGRKPVLVEVGPGQTLSVLAAQTVKRDELAAVVQSLPLHDSETSASETVAETHGRLWSVGVDLSWPVSRAARRIALPTYPFQRESHWIKAPAPIRQQSVPAPAHHPPADASAADPIPALPSVENGMSIMNASAQPFVASRVPALETSLLSLLAEMAGDDLGPDSVQSTFLELGYDSLFIGQFAQRIEKQYKTKLSFRQLLSSIPTIAALAQHLDSELPPEQAQAAPVAAATAQMPATTSQPLPATMAVQPVAMPAANAASGDLGTLLQVQMQTMQQLFAQQLQAVQNMTAAPAPVPAPAASASVATPASPPKTEPTAAKPADDAEIGGGRIKLYRPGAAETQLSPQKQRFIADLAEKYSQRNRNSKAFTEQHRGHLADPRAASGFRSDLKEIVFPVVSDKSKGSRIWDIDGNEYIDLVNGMGQTAFGHAPDFVLDAVSTQLKAGFAIGPQTPLAGEVAALISELTGHERVTFCNTGSEAVMAAMRVARAVTGRDRVVVFGNDYHGQFDEVLVKGRNKSGTPVALPIAVGIPQGSVSNMTVLRYGEAESLEWIRNNADDIAAVIIEPIQSRHPEFQPVEFVRSLREIATASEFALVFDEVVTGFRVHPGGIQAVWGIRGDMATYGKVLGGGMPIGVLAGDARFMDALDGGQWQYGDASVPMVAPTFFAGTFVRHPVVLAAVKAVLNHIKGDGQALYERVAEHTQSLVAEINEHLDRRGVADRLETYKSWFVTNFSHSDPLGTLIYPLLRMQGIHIQDGYPCFLTTAHSEADFRQIADAFKSSVDTLQAAGILTSDRESIAPSTVAPASEPATQEAPIHEAPLTEAQTEIWLSAQLGDEASCAFNESFRLTLDGALDVDAFRAALDDVVARHDALHIRFARTGESFEIIPDFVLELENLDFSSDANRVAKLGKLIVDDARQPFDLVEGPLVRARLVRMSPENHVFVLSAHHIVCDGWSMNVILEELSACYAARVTGSGSDLEPAMSFAAYAAGLDTAVPSAETETYWLDQFRQIPDLPDLPLDRPRPERRTFSGGTQTVHIEPEICKAVRTAGARNGATLFSTLLATLQIMISRLSGSSDIVIAVPSAGQSLVEDKTLVGHCVNLLPIRQTVSTDTSFSDHLKETQKLVLQAFEHQDYTYGTLVRKLGQQRDPSRLPLTEIQFNLERVAHNLSFPSLKTAVTPNPKAFSNFDMFLNMIDGDNGLRIDVDFNRDVFDPHTIERWLDHFRTMLISLAADTGQQVAAIPLLNTQQSGWLLHGLNETAADYPRDKFMFDLFAEQAKARPDAIAAEHNGTRLSFRELEEQSNRLARHIRMQLPDPGQRVAIATDRSLDMLVTLLAVMKAGHTYVPLDAGHPAARLRQVMETARISGLVCNSSAIAEIAMEGTSVIRMDLDADAIAAMDGGPLDTRPTSTEMGAYVIFTSGSTGTPKGVEVSHRALVNFLTSMAVKPGFTADDTIVAVTTISFDIAALELYLPLIAGGRTIIADRIEVQDGFALVKRIVESGATVVQATPTLWMMLLEAGLKDQPHLKMLCGGEPLPRDLANRMLQVGGELWNMYGPTETTIWSSLARVEAGDAPISIGEPIANTQLLILDEAGRLAPVGVIGELHIGGDGLANGYFDQPELTAKAFVEIAIGDAPPQRLYKTGDVGRRLPDGSLQLLGRRDQQIKLRGFRIELGDIESVIQAAAGIKNCAVALATARNGDKQLVCYFVPLEGTQPIPADLAAHAAANLPTHMVPVSWISLEALPQTANGKLDRKALTNRPAPQREAAPAIKMPMTPMEEKLAGIWKDVLKIDDVGVHDNLYSLGADSLSIFRMAARMMDQGLALEAKHLLRYPTISELAVYAQTQNIELPAAIPSLRDFRNGARRGLGRLPQ